MPPKAQGSWIAENPEMDRLQAAFQVVRKELDDARVELVSSRAAVLSSNAEVVRLKQLVEARDSTISALQNDFEKAKVTIKEQSALIGKTPAPRRPAAQHGVPPPPSLQRQQSSSSVYNPGRLSSMVPQGQSMPLPTLHREASIPGPSQALVSAQWQPSPHPPSTQELVTKDNDFEVISFTEDFNQIFKLVTDFGRSFANVPSERDKVLAPAVVGRFASYTKPNHLAGIMRSGSTRYLVVARYIAEVITNDVFHIKSFKDFKAPGIQTLGEVRKGKQAAQPTSLARAYKQVEADVVKGMIAMTSEMNAFIEKKAEWMSNGIYRTLEPLMVAGSDQAKNDLGYLMYQALELSAKLHSTTAAFTYSYPDAGDDTLFDPSTMISRDVNSPANPSQLQSQGYKVRLCATPVVTVQDVMTDVINPKTVHFAEVLSNRFTANRGIGTMST